MANETAMKPDFDMRFNDYSVTDLITTANSAYKLSYLDRGDLYNLIVALSDSLENHYTEYMNRSAREQYESSK